MKIIALVFSIAFGFSANAQNSINVVPMPSEVKMGKGNFLINPNTQIVLEGSHLEKCAAVLNDYLFAKHGVKLRVVKKSSANSITLNFERLDNDLPGAYHLTADKNGIYIAGDNEEGVFYGLQTMLQLLEPPQKTAAIPRIPSIEKVPYVTIKDHPRFAYRGMHLDVARHFFSVNDVKKYIDYLATYKFNTFHWHLTDDQGWRIEIKKYPRLTSIGGYRNGTIIGRYPGTGNDSIHYGGYYTQQQIKDVVKYAADRYITVIPEIELPGHASAAIAAYPLLSCFPDEDTKVDEASAWAGPRKGKQVQQTAGVFEDVFAPTDYTFNFFNDVMDEVMQLFPSKYIHIGGDECPKEAWKRSAFCQQLIKDKNLKDEHGLQSYFIGRIEKYLNSKGRKIIGWDEILEGGLASNATVMSWRGEEGGIDAAKQNHDVIMTPGGYCYFDHSQSKNEDSVTFGSYLPLETVYSYDPVPASLNAAQAKHILGAQGNVWTEYISNPAKLEYTIFPRIFALSEVLWTPKEKKDWKDFERRLPVLFDRLDAQKINYSKAYYDLKTTILPSTDNEGVIYQVIKRKNNKQSIVTTEFIDSASKRWGITRDFPNDTVNLKLKKETKWINAYLFNVAPPYPPPYPFEYFFHEVQPFITIHQELHFNKATGKNISIATPPSKSYPGNGAFTLVDGIQNTKGLSKSNEFLGFEGTDLDVMIELASSKTPVNKITLHVLDLNASWIYLPSSVEVTFLPDMDLTPEIIAGSPKTTVHIDPIKQKGQNTISIENTQQCRWLHIVAKNFGTIPAGNPGAGNKAWLFADEIEVE
jgi:hexosaminidase